MTSSPIRLSDIQLRAVQAAAETVPYDLRQAYLERVADELRGRDLNGADGLVHRVAREVAREIRWGAGTG